jgi:hypothetical protein
MISDLKKKVGTQTLTESKCPGRSTLVERSVESLDTVSRDCSFRKQSSCFFKQLPQSRLERGFGNRSAVFASVDGNQTLEENRKMTIDTEGQRKLIPGLIYSLKGRSEDDGGMAHPIYCVKGETNGHCCKIPH